MQKPRGSNPCKHQEMKGQKVGNTDTLEDGA